MRPPRLVLIGTVMISALASGSAQARPQLPGFFGAFFGAVGSIVGAHEPHGYAHEPHAHEPHAYAPVRHRTRHARSAAVARRADRGVPPARSGAPANAGQIDASDGAFWPQLADDLFDYVLWPSGKDDRFWAHGYNDVVGGALRPASRTSERPHVEASADGAALASGCAGEQGAETADSLIARIELTVRPTEAQRPLLADLKAAVQRGLDYIDKACSARTETPTARLDAMEDRIWAARQAVLIARAPLDKLDASLSDEQKARLSGTGGQRKTTTRAAGCTASNADPIAPIVGRIRPTPTERPALQALQMTSAGLARLVAASCPSALPSTQVGRLDAADRRLNALLYAVATLRAPLDGLTAALTDQQKADLAGSTRK